MTYALVDGGFSSAISWPRQHLHSTDGKAFSEAATWRSHRASRIQTISRAACWGITIASIVESQIGRAEDN